MPSPSKLTLVTSLIATTGIIIGGAWTAAGMTNEAPVVDAPIALNSYIPAPVPRLFEAGSQEILVSNHLGSTDQSEPIHITSPDGSAVPEAPQDVNSGLSLTINGVRNTDGRVIVMVFDKQATYDAHDYENTAGYIELSATFGKMSHTFVDLTEGPYVVSLFHDENSDYEFNMSGENPLEGYSTSGATGPYDIPSFKKASVMPGDVTVSIYYID